MSLGERIGEFKVWPLYGAVEIGDVNAGDVPQWESGHEVVVFNSQLVVVACQSDQDGEVVGEVWQGDFPPAWPEAPVFEGEVLLTTPQLFVGNSIAHDGVTFEVGVGWRRLVVVATPPGAASTLKIAVLPPVSESETSAPAPS